jgi:hypothetical protein
LAFGFAFPADMASSRSSPDKKRDRGAPQKKRADDHKGTGGTALFTVISYAQVMKEI